MILKISKNQEVFQDHLEHSIVVEVVGLNLEVLIQTIFPW